MFWYGDHMNGWGYGLMGVSMLLFWAAFLAGGFALVRFLTRSSTSEDDGRPRLAEEMLAERYARGDIDHEEYRQRQETLRTRHQNTASRL